MAGVIRRAVPGGNEAPVSGGEQAQTRLERIQALGEGLT